MSLRKKTIRRMPEKTREIAKLYNELDAICQKIKNRLSVIASLELDSIALAKARSLISLQPARDQVKKTIQEASEQEELFPEQKPAEKPKPSRKRKEKVSNGKLPSATTMQTDNPLACRDDENPDTIVPDSQVASDSP